MNDAIIMTPITQGAENTLWPPLTCWKKIINNNKVNNLYLLLNIFYIKNHYSN